MTKKIINGIDVSGCKYYNNGTYEEEPYCGIDEEHPYTCISDENCYYKQMKKLEAENVKLKEKYQEELTVNTQLRKWQDEDLRQIAELKKDLDLLRKAHDTEQTQKRMFEYKLEKIKELATPLRCNNPLDCWMNQDEGTGDIYGCEGDDYKGCPYGFASCILKIIEGAEDE